MTCLQQILIFCQKVRYSLKFAPKKQICSFILTTTLQTLRWLRSLPEWGGRWHHICPPRWARTPLKVQLALKVHHKLYHLIYYCQPHWNRQGGSIGVAMYPIPGPWRRPPKPHFLVMSRSYFNLPPSAYTPVYLYPTSICTTTCEFIETCENVRDRFFLSRQNKLLFLSLILLLDLLERVSVALNFLNKSRPNKQQCLECLYLSLKSQKLLLNKVHKTCHIAEGRIPKKNIVTSTI